MIPPHFFYEIYLSFLRKSTALHQNVVNCQNTELYSKIPLNWLIKGLVVLSIKMYFKDLLLTFVGFL